MPDGAFSRLTALVAYIRGDMDVQTLTVRGRILPNYRYTRVVASGLLPGGFPITINFITRTQAATVILQAAGSAFVSTAGNVFLLSAALDGGTVQPAFTKQFCNVNNSHVATPMGAQVFSGVNPGPHSIQVTLSGTTAASDTNDNLGFTVWEQPA